MKLTLKKGAKNLKPKKKLAASKPKRKSFDLNEFIKSLQTLDYQNYGSWPIAVKIFALLIMICVMSALAYSLPISSKYEEVKAAEAEQETLLNTFREKESKARQLEAYKAQVEQMEQEFTVLLNQLPKDTRVSDLVDSINAAGMGSNIRFVDISAEPEVQQEFFIEQPINIKALGNYHEFGNFVSGLAALPRIITMHDFDVVNTQPSFDKMPDLTLTLKTKTYRSKDPEQSTANSEQAAEGGSQ